MLVVDDEYMIRNAVKRVFSNHLKELKSNIELEILEACDGIECILALYLYTQRNGRVDIIISDETFQGAFALLL